jgi:hypothetical protein
MSERQGEAGCVQREAVNPAFFCCGERRDDTIGGTWAALGVVCDKVRAWRAAGAGVGLILMCVSGKQKRERYAPFNSLY